MIKNNRIYKNAFRFCRWSRNAYAAFCSIGKCVTIGYLKKAIVECSVLKLGNVISEENNINASIRELDEDKESHAPDLLNALMATGASFCMLSPVVSLVSTHDKKYFITDN